MGRTGKKVKAAGLDSRVTTGNRSWSCHLDPFLGAFLCSARAAGAGSASIFLVSKAISGISRWGN